MNLNKTYLKRTKVIIMETKNIPKQDSIEFNLINEFYKNRKVNLQTGLTAEMRLFDNFILQPVTTYLVTLLLYGLLFIF